MCGLAGIWHHRRDDDVPAPVIARMVDRLRHRGPDDSGAFTDGNLAVVHTRLSIVDTSEAGRQPFRNERFVLVYNGEIYNHLEIRRVLEREGQAFIGHSDTETLFHALIRLGVDATLERIRGMFAFAFIDLEERRLWLCRDRLGIKPLFWHADARGIAFASEIKAIAGPLGLRPDPVRTLYAVSGIADHSNTYTVFSGVEHVPPGSFLTWHEGGTTCTSSYHDILDDLDPVRFRSYAAMSPADLTAEFTRIFTRSVTDMRMSDVPLGVFVSGGVDSSLVAAEIARQGADLGLFTANIVGRHSEYNDAKRLADALHLPLHDTPFETPMMLEHWTRCTWHYEAPIVTHVNAIPFSRVAALAREHAVKAVLTGEGPDELFLGYPRVIMRAVLSRMGAKHRMLGRGLESLKLIPKLGAQHASTPEAFFNVLVQRFERQVLREEGFGALDFLPVHERVGQYFTIQMIREHLLSLLYRNDRMGMQEGIESRFPFLDEEMVAFALHIPLSAKHGVSLRLHDRKHPFLLDKKILRMAAQRVLPTETAFKRKNGFPMNGHKATSIAKGFFRGGYVAEALGLDSRALDYMHDMQPAYQIGKLASVEIFGRLFAMDHCIESIDRHVREYCSIRVS